MTAFKTLLVKMASAQGLELDPKKTKMKEAAVFEQHACFGCNALSRNIICILLGVV